MGFGPEPKVLTLIWFIPVVSGSISSRLADCKNCQFKVEPVYTAITTVTGGLRSWLNTSSVNAHLYSWDLSPVVLWGSRKVKIKQSLESMWIHWNVKSNISYQVFWCVISCIFQRNCNKNYYAWFEISDFPVLAHCVLVFLEFQFFSLNLHAGCMTS